jgi:ribosomal protein S18 acetylase RimI-like enzyme
LSDQIRYREGNARDALDIVNFQIEMARETESVELNRHVCSRGVEAVFEDRSLGRYYVAESGATLIGSLMITFEWSDWRNGVVWWIQSVYVRPEFRRQRVYARLYEHVRSLADQNESVKGIRLYVDTRNEPAQEVYRRMGMNGEHYRVFEWMKS